MISVKSKYLLIFFSLVFSSFFSFLLHAVTFDQPAENLVVLFNKGYDNGAIVDELKNAIDQGVGVIASHVLLYHLKPENAAKLTAKIDSADVWNKLISEDWQIYQNKKYEGDFFVLIPKTKELADFGLNAFALEKVSPTELNKISRTFSEMRWNRAISLDNFEKLFSRSLKTYKRIYLSGHGGENVIAQLNINDWVRFVEILDTYNAQFLIISSCFSAGMNMVALQEQFNNALRSSLLHAGKQAETGVDIRVRTIRYPIVMLSTTDAPVVGGGIKDYFKIMFANLNEWIKKNPYFGKTQIIPLAGQKTDVKIKDVLAPFYVSISEMPSSLPFIRMPGNNSTFKEVRLDNIAVIDGNTLLKLKAQSLPLLIEKRRVEKELQDVGESFVNLEERSRQRGFTESIQIKLEKDVNKFIELSPKPDQLATEIKQVKEKMPEFKIPENAAYLLVYPADLRGITISTQVRYSMFSHPAAFISKIPGNAHHFIEEFYAPNLKFTSFADYMIFQDPSIKNKAWFMQYLACRDEKVRAVVFFSLPGIMVVLKENDNKYLLEVSKGSFEVGDVAEKEITKTEYEQLIDLIYATTKPDEQALKEASPYETLQSLDEAFNHFLKNADLNQPKKKLDSKYYKKPADYFKRFVK